MLSRSILTIFALVLLCVYVVESNSSVKCRQHEVYTTCASCQKTCEYPEPRRCPLLCREGCTCINGYVRDENNKCIPVRKCPRRVEPAK